MSLADVSIKRPVFISMVLFALVLFGFIAYRNMGIDLYPKVDFPVISVISVVPAADPETIETSVTDPIEEVLSAVNGIKNLRSISAEGVSHVIVEFELEKDVHVAYQEVQAKIGTIRSRLPLDLEGPVIEKFDIDSAPILTVIASAPLPVGELTEIVDKEIKQPLRKVSNIGQIKMIGGRETKIWLWIDRQKLEANQLSIQDIERAIRSNHLDLPAGHITKDTSEISLKTKGELQTAKKFENLVVANKNGVPIYFRDIGKVEEGLEEERSLAHLNQHSAIALLIGRQSGSNSVEVANQIKSEISHLKETFEARQIRLDIAQDNSIYIEHSVSEVRFHLFFGGGLAVLIVLLFLRNLRSTFVCALALPTAVIGTFAFMDWMGFSQNMMTLLALSIAIGLLIDDAIVVQENIIRHLEEGKSATEASSIGTKQIALAVLATTLSVVAVFVPVAFMKGIVGRFFYQFGLTVSFAVLISMFVSFTLNPMLSSKLLRPHQRGKIDQFLENIFKSMEAGYAKILRFSLRRKWLIILLAFVSFVGSIFLGKFLRFEFMTMEDQSELSINVQAPQGSSLKHTLKLIEDVESHIQNKPWVEYFFSTIGGDTLHAVNQGSIYVKMVEKKQREISQQKAMDLMREELANKSDATITVQPVQRVSGGGKMTDLQFEVRGPSLEKLQQLADTIIQKMRASTGYVDISTSSESGKPELEVHIKRELAADLGVSPLMIASTIKAAFGGMKVATFKKDADRYDVVIRFLEKYRNQIDQILLLSVPNQRGELIPLSQLIELKKKQSPTQIDRCSRTRQITIFTNLNRSQKVLGEAITEIHAIMREVGLPAGYSYAFTGAAENFKESFGHLVFALFLAVILVYMVLAAQFESFMHPFIIMLSLPLSIIGAIGALVTCNMTMSIFTMIGMIMLMGLVTKNGILLVDFINTLIHQEKMERNEAIIRAGTLRLRPILMTTFAVVFGMLPVAIGVGEGSESQAPMAVAVIGGLLTSTLLTLLVVPVAYQVLENFHAKRRAVFNRVKLIFIKK